MKTEETALILIDLQKESNFDLQQLDNVISKTKTVTEACRNAGIPIIYTRQINRHDQVALSKGEPIGEDKTPLYYSTAKENHEILDEIAPATDDIVIDKYRWSAFYETSLDSILRSLGVKNLIVGGVVTDGCVMTTVFDAYFRDYKVHLVKDICTTSNEGSHMSSLMIMANWVYNLEVYNAEDLINRVNGELYNHWKFKEADAFQFTPENMRNVYQNLNSEERKDK